MNRDIGAECCVLGAERKEMNTKIFTGVPSLPYVRGFKPFRSTQYPTHGTDLEFFPSKQHAALSTFAYV
ncbi:MAG TPA: hypothetical protein VF934_07240 [Burkholderiales bacterium]